MTIRQGTTIISGGGGKVTSVNGEIGDVVVKSVVNEKDNSTQLKFWLGTQEEYEQITEKDDATIYYTQGEDSSAISYNDLTDKPTINTVPLSGDMTLAELGIQGELQAGTGITIEDNVISATVVGGVTSVNGQTGDVTVEGLKDQNTVNTGLLKFWTGTKEQYAEIETKDPNTLYYVGETLTPATLATVATTGLYADLLEKPQINTVILEGNKTSSDLGLQDAETALNYNNITNCITKIPQDIKLELADGTLTLKAGSKVYKGDGTAVTVNSDVTHNVLGSTGKCFFVLETNSLIARCEIDKSYSQDTEPTDIIVGSLWYNTTTKEIKRYGGSTWNNVISLPLCICSLSNGDVVSIDQVFNGFSYIGNTIFVLPGVKGRIPNGFNADGGLNSIEFTTSRVLTNTIPTSYNNVTFDFNIDGGRIAYYNKGKGYVNSENLYYVAIGATATANIGEITVGESGRITSLTPNTAFHAVDYSEYAREVGRCAKLDEENVFEANNTFRSNFNLQNKTTDINNVTTPTSNNIYFRDKNGYMTGVVQRYYGETGSDNMSMTLIDKDGNKGTISINKRLSGDVYVTIPQPKITDNGQQAVTANWVNSKFQVVSTLPAEPDPNVFYFIPEE